MHRNLLIGNAVVGSGAYIYLKNTWGAPTGRFHFKDDLNDNMAFTDEISHFYFGYKLTEGFRWLFRTLKMPEDKTSRYAGLQAAFVLTFVEFPLDAFNPDQGMGVTDLAFNYAGIGWALMRPRLPQNIDVKFSVKQPPWKFENKFLASKNEEFDNFIWWATYKPRWLWLGLGYSTNHDQFEVESEFYLGLGTTLYDLVWSIDRGLADDLRALDSYFISFRWRL